jgi:DnaK suppressor protein
VAERVEAGASVQEVSAYRDAHATYRGGDYDACIDRFRGFLQTYPASPYADDAAYWMAECHFKKGDYKSAVLRFDDVVARYPEGDKSADALYRQGDALLNSAPATGGGGIRAGGSSIRTRPGGKRRAARSLGTRDSPPHQTNGTSSNRDDKVEKRTDKFRSFCCASVDRERTPRAAGDIHLDPDDFPMRWTPRRDWSWPLGRLRARARAITKIDQALAKIEANEFGLCESCGEEIGIKRLEARPVAELCIDCKSEQERLERRMG